MFHLNRDLAAREIQWRGRKLYFLEAWNYPEVNTATAWNFRTGFLEDYQLEAWLNRTGEFAPPLPPPGVGIPHGGIRLLACHYTLFKWAAVGLSHEAFQRVESRFQLHPATLPALEVAAGTFSRHFYRDRDGFNKLSIILKAPQKYEIGNNMLSLTHDFNSRWTTALLAGESIVTSAIFVEDIVPLPLGPLSPCVAVRAYLSASPALWDHPLTLPCIILTHHLRRLQKYVTGDLTPGVMHIEEQLGVTRVGRRNSERLWRTTDSKDTGGRPVERIRAEYLTVNINTELTRIRFTSHNPKWNYEASALILNILGEMHVFRDQLGSAHGEISNALEHNVTLAKSLEDHVLGLQKRLELQLNVLYSFVAQTDNQLNARLAATAGRDSTSMKILAFITTIFLPGSFVATLFSMEMFTWEASSSSSDGPSISPSFWIYWAVAAPLTGLTLCGWALWWSFEKHRYDQHLQDSVNSAAEVSPPPWWQRLLRRTEPPRPGGDGNSHALQVVGASQMRNRAARAGSPGTAVNDEPEQGSRPMRRLSRTR